MFVLVQGRKTAAQVQRLEALHAKQQAVLRRKTEEAEAARKRLHVSCCFWQYTHSGHRLCVSFAAGHQPMTLPSCLVHVSGPRCQLLMRHDSTIEMHAPTLLC